MPGVTGVHIPSAGGKGSKSLGQKLSIKTTQSTKRKRRKKKPSKP